MIVVAEAWREPIAAGMPPTRVAPIPNPQAAAEAERFAALRAGPRSAARTEAPAEAVRVTTLCRLEPGKGVERLLAAFVHLDAHYTLTVAGTGSLRAHLAARVEALGLAGRVAFVGWQEAEAKAELLRRADVFCLASTYQSFGLMYFEALSYGVPVIAADRAVMRAVLPASGCAFADPDAPVALAAAITDMARAGIDWPAVTAEVLERYDGERVVEALTRQSCAVAARPGGAA